MKQAVLLDLGNTLVRYWVRPEYPALLAEALGKVCQEVHLLGLPLVPVEIMGERAAAEDCELPDHRVRPLQGRLDRIFELAPDVAGTHGKALCRAFLKPMFARGQCYSDTKPFLRRLADRGVRTAIVSNTPWGSPGDLWREELDRLGLRELVDVTVFCTDAGWRKPARQVFDLALDRLPVQVEDAIFVGDVPRWDLDGPRRIGMEAIVIQRGAGVDGPGEGCIASLDELWQYLAIL